MEQVDERVSVRIEKAVMDRIDHEVRKHGYINRSEFLRQAAKAKLEAGERQNAITVELSDLLWGYIDSLVRLGYFRTRELAVEYALMHYFTEECQAKLKSTSASMEVAAGRKVEAEVGGRPGQIVRP